MFDRIALYPTVPEASSVVSVLVAKGDAVLVNPLLLTSILESAVPYKEKCKGNVYITCRFINVWT